MTTAPPSANVANRLLFATGGTGGHIFPALAIANRASQAGYPVSFIGQNSGMEARLVPEAGFEFHGVTAGKWDRGRPNPMEGVRAGWGTLESLQHVAKLNPALVLGFGGFASFPGVVAARLLNKPYILHESNAYPGKVTRWFAKDARRVVIAQQATRKHLNAAAQTEQIGFPVREQKVDKQRARRELGLPQDGLVTLVMGGSQGSVRLNEAVPAAFKAVSQNVSSLSVLHSTGPKWLDQVKSYTDSLENYHAVGFVDAVLAWSAADLAITRGGFGTLAEAAFHGVPCIIVPLPSAAENHQLHNARAVAKAGAGWVVEEKGLPQLSDVWRAALASDTLFVAVRAALSHSSAGAPDAFLSLIQTVLASPTPRGKQERT